MKIIVSLPTLFVILVIILMTSGCSNKASSRLNNLNAKSDTTSMNDQSNVKKTKLAASFEVANIYAHAIEDYIKLVKLEYKLNYDTLFFGKHKYEQPGDFPNIELPKSINTTQIRLITPDQGEKNRNVRKSSCYINLIGTVNEEVAEFIFTNFSNDFAHQYDCFINYKYDTLVNKFKQVHFRFEDFRHLTK